MPHQMKLQPVGLAPAFLLSAAGAGASCSQQESIKGGMIGPMTAATGVRPQGAFQSSGLADVLTTAPSLQGFNVNTTANGSDPNEPQNAGRLVGFHSNRLLSASGQPLIPLFNVKDWSPAPVWSVMPGIDSYKGRVFHKDVASHCVRLLPCGHHEGFFMAKFKKCS